jgi:hypothetical protein
MPFPETDNSTGNVSSGNTNPDKGNEPTNSERVPLERTQAPTFQVDPRFAALSEQEAIARTVQSMVTPLHQQIKELSEKEKKYSEYIEGLGLIFENRDARLAFIRELEPDLVKTPDIDDAVKNELDKKYGEDFIPDKNEANEDHWSKSAKYFRDMEKFYKKYENSDNGSYKTYKEIKSEYEKNRANKTKAAEKEINELKEMYGIGDEEVQAFKGYLQNMTVKDFYMQYKNISGEQNNNYLSSLNGSNISIDKRIEKLNQLFGK